MSSKWLRCKVQKGMFSDELTVVIRAEGGEDVAFFVPKSEVEVRNNLARVRVKSFDQNRRAWAVVPNDQQTLIPVDPAEFVAA